MPALPLHGMSTARQKTGLCRRREGSSGSSACALIAMRAGAESLSCDLLTSYRSDDQFGYEEVLVIEPVFFANPVFEKWHGEHVTGVWNPDDHLVFYWIDGGDFVTELSIANQFGPQEILVQQGMLFDFLGVPSVKVFAEPET
ncbi:MAG: hypothetical protein IMY79_01335 [Chloroflexi bacterium]|nr:hypothetical protein [Chloroflexota bacterium]